MRKAPIAEWLLARIIGRDRAAVIMGDLEELAATRGRLWFWTAYVRALVSLGWRTGVPAFLFALVCALKYGTVIRWLLRHRTASLSDAGAFGENNPHIRVLCWNLAFVTAEFVVFAFPFVWTRFGLHDRLTRLACTLVLVSLPVYSFHPWLMDISGVLTPLVLAAAVVAPPWRKPLTVLAGAFLPAVAVKAALFSLQFSLSGGVSSGKIFHQPAHWVLASDTVSFAIAAIVCLRLYRLLLRQRPVIA